MEENNTINLKPISELLGMNFFIPSYQRGYRWTEQQVKDLLNDIDQFQVTENSWYCLQPLVVRKKSDNEFEVIDGQQRLTTISLIIHYFNEMWVGKQKIKEPQISYETRSDSSDFLKNIEIDATTKKVKVTANDNIDYFHIATAYQTIHNWVAEKSSSFDNNSFQSKFQQKTRVIWYEINDNDNPIDTFIRINMGKIPLTNSELIKALFLQKRNFGDAQTAELRQIEIANEWDRIEYTLQNDDFWGFINKTENEKPARIEFLFDLMCKNNSLKLKDYETAIGTDEYKTFRYFSYYFQSNTDASILNLWNDVKDFFLVLEEWFDDRELYHKVGYLIVTGKDISEIYKSSYTNKDKFVEFLNAEIAKQIKCDKIKIEDLEYGENNKKIQDILLLHNIQTLLNNANETTKFPFAKSKADKWSLEHIHAQNSKELTTIDQFNEWLKGIDQTELSDDLKTKIREVTEETVSSVIADIAAFFGELDLHTIENLALLWKNDNSALNNSIFPVKRNKIIELEKQGSFIPICTRNVFLKYYTNEKLQLSKWTEDDRKAYLENIKTNTINIYKN